MHHELVQHLLGRMKTWTHVSLECRGLFLKLRQVTMVKVLTMSTSDVAENNKIDLTSIVAPQSFV